MCHRQQAQLNLRQVALTDCHLSHCCKLCAPTMCTSVAMTNTGSKEA